MNRLSEWRSAAACRDTDPETFFPAAKSGPIYEAQVAAAKAICAGCRVRVECLEEALVRIPDGIVAGLTPEERRGIHPRRVRGVELEVLAGAGPGEVQAVGLGLLAAGRPVREVARRCGVTERTVVRWAARTTTNVATSSPAASTVAGSGRCPA